MFNNTLVRLLNVYWLVIFYYFIKKTYLVTYIYKIGETTNQQEEFTNNKLFDAVLDLKSNLNKNTASVEQIANNLEEMKIQQNDLKKDLLSFKSNTQAAVKALEASQQAVGESQDFINEEFETWKVKQGTSEERAKAAETKIINMKAEIHSLQETILDEQSNVNHLEQYGRRNMFEINNIPFTTDENLESVITDIARKSMKLDHFNYKQYVDVAHRLNSKLTIPLIIQQSINAGRILSKSKTAEEH